MKLKEIAKIVNGKLHNGDPNKEIENITSIEEATGKDLTWIAHPRYEKYLRENNIKPGCILVKKDKKVEGKTTIEVDDPFYGIVILLEKFYPPEKRKPEIHKFTYIEKGVKLGKNVGIAPFSYIGEKVKIGANVSIGMHCYVGKEVEIGEGSIISHNVTILERVILGRRVKIYPNTVIGGPGFAYINKNGKHVHIPHKGKVIIEDEVEIGALSSIDRALVGATVIKKGTKIDNMVHIAHNVIVGENSIIVAQAGIAGSVMIGDNVIIGGQAGITDHIRIGDGAKIGGQAGVTKDVPSKEVVCGYPARPRRVSNLAYSLLTKLPELFKRVKKIEEKCKIQ